MTVTERPELTFGMVQAGRDGAESAVRALKMLFGSDNYKEFKKAGRKGTYIPQESRIRVDREVCGRVGEWFGVEESKRDDFWKESLSDADYAVDVYARKICFVDGGREAMLTTDIVVDRRPSSALARLTLPDTKIDLVCRYEQGRQLALALSAAEIKQEDKKGDAEKALAEIHDLLVKNLFAGKVGGIEDYLFYSYHEPETNKLIGLSKQYPNPHYKGTWVKKHKEPVRSIEIKDQSGRIVTVIKALYDPDQKDTGSAVIKAWQRSLKNANAETRNAKIQTSPHREDGTRLMIVPMITSLAQGRVLRDFITTEMGKVLEKLPGFIKIKPDDEVNPKNGDPSRFLSRRRKIYTKTLEHRPIEAAILSLGDYISQLYEVGSFDPRLGMHTGPAHPLYKLRRVAEIAEFLWPTEIFHIDLEEAFKLSSHHITFDLCREKRIDTSPYAISPIII